MQTNGNLNFSQSWELQKQCPLCHGPLFLRHYDEHGDIKYWRCMRCGVLVNDLARERTDQGHAEKYLEYEDDYFGRDYAQQYGRTYAQDQPQIKQLAEKRLQRLRSCVSLSRWEQLQGQPLIDLGCALGFFLDAARAQGLSDVQGLEVSRYAADYAQEQMGLSVRRESLVDWVPDREYGVISLFYVLEHFQDQLSIWQKVSQALVPGGFLLLALPSTWGPHYVFQGQSWLEQHPHDHYIDYNPLSLRVLAPGFGLRIQSIFPGPLHWERFPGDVQSLLDYSDKIKTNVKPAAQRIFSYVEFGDTMEIIAQKI